MVPLSLYIYTDTARVLQVYPPQNPEIFMHEYVLAGWGMPIGTSFLSDLVKPYVSKANELILQENYLIWKPWQRNVRNIKDGVSSSHLSL